MTTTTRTTRKAPWAVFVTALLAVLAVVLGSLVIAAPAHAKNDPDKTPPGQSETFVPPGQDGSGDPTVNPGHGGTPPGQTNTPPGQNPGDTPGSSHDKMTICHWVEGKGETKDGYNVITMNEQAWAAHLAHHPGTLDVVYNGGCPYVEPEPDLCPADSLHPLTVLPAPYNEATDYETCYGTNPTPKYYCPPDSAVKTELGHQYDAVADLATCYPVGVVQTIPPQEATAIDEVVAAGIPQPATVAAPSPAKVTVPAKGPTVPATVPAGDGSSVPTLPVTALALLVLGATALAASTARLVGAKR